MRRFFSLLVLVALPWLAPAQTFTFTQSGGIPDHGPEVCFDLPVTGLPAVLDSTFGLKSVCLNATHTYDGDLTFRLRAPDGTYVMLVNRRGGSGDNFVSTCLMMNAPAVIATGQAPFTGSYMPEQSLNSANNGQNPNGTWRLCAQDAFMTDSGILNSFSITFGANPPPDPPTPPGPCSATNPRNCRCQDSTQVVCDLLPDMTASGAIIAQQHTEVPGMLTLSNATPNIGWGPMEIHGSGQCFCDTVPVSCTTTVCPNGDAPKERITQRIYRKTAANAMTTTERPAGYMSYHPSHGHVHVDSWAAFTLRRPTANPDARTWPIVASGAKVSFCLVNLGTCNNNNGYCVDSNGQTLTMADIPNAGFGTVTGCGRDQGIYVGHLDVYGQGLAGMNIPLNGVCNGTYQLVSITDPDDNFLESDENNNWVAVPITLTEQVAAPAPTFSWSQIGNQLAFSTGPLQVGATFVWDFNDGSPVDSVNNPTIHGFLTPGTHSVTLTVHSPCGTDSVTRILTVLSAATDEAGAPELRLRAAPNPTSGVTTLRYGLTRVQRVTLEAVNLLGERVRYRDLGLQAAGEQATELDLGADLPAGVYVIRLRAERGTQAVRVVKN